MAQIAVQRSPASVHDLGVDDVEVSIVIVVVARWARRMVGLEIDALAGAPLGGIDGGRLVAAGDGDAPGCGDARGCGVPDHHVTVMDVADPVLEHDEQLGAMVHAEAGARAAVLVDPHQHRRHLRAAGRRPEARLPRGCRQPGNRVATYAVVVPGTAIVVVVPAAEPVVGADRMRHDPMAARGVPAHVTILYPFRPELDDAAARRVDAICRSFAAFQATFATVGRFPEGVLWLRPEPGDVFRALIDAFVAAFPDCPPYGGEFAEVIPHLTVGTGLEAEDAASLEPTLAARLPVTATVDRLTLLVEDDRGRWHIDRSWPLGSSAMHGREPRADGAESGS